MASLIQKILDAPDYSEYSPWFPNPLIVLRDMVQSGASEVYARLPWNGIGVWLKETWDQMYTTIFLDWNVFLFPLLIATAFTLVRVVANHFLLKVGITPLLSNTSLSSVPVHMTPHMHTHTANSSLFQVKSRKL